MFKPNLKETGWEEIREEVIDLSGEDYRESRFIGKKVEIYPHGYIVKDDLSYTPAEIEMLSIFNDGLIDIIWDTTTEEELEKHLENIIKDIDIDVLSLRLQLDETAECFFGWLHFREDKKIKTFKFKITFRGFLDKC